jgi:hypothetical protein
MLQNINQTYKKINCISVFVFAQNMELFIVYSVHKRLTLTWIPFGCWQNSTVSGSKKLEANKEVHSILGSTELLDHPFGGFTTVLSASLQFFILRQVENHTALQKRWL